MKRLHIWIVVLFLLLHITGAFAETIVIDDCGVCQGHVIVGTNRDGYDVELTKMLAEHYEEEEIIIGYDAVSITAGVHHIILDNVLIDVSDQENVAAFSIHPGAEVFLKLENESILLSGENCAGIQVPQGAKLCIMEESAGSLMAWGGQKGAGIGGGAQQRCGEIVISGGTIIAK